ncbi:hypothetical protein JIR001_07970 [Polycladomyces abyssicola]|uniref:Uncharacterized protein n=1 Tax=Polycladomyces abyssicola TaxID=1125966 RepID=A0A8D5ZK06_9BACL|nr:hypothetical protein JIR001_07970 [Polycladomyces abyssicola]
MIGEVTPSYRPGLDVMGLDDIGCEMASANNLVLDMGTGDGFGSEMFGNNGL